MKNEIDLWQILHNSTKTTEEICEIVHKVIDDGEYEVQYFSMLVFNYCGIGDFQPLTWIIMCTLIILCFYFLSSTGNDYLSEALGILADKLKCSQNLAGLTLLAFGNQAPDIAAAYVAGGTDEGVANSLSSLLGGGSFVIGIVLSCVILFGKTTKVHAGNYIRDLCTYLIALIIILVVGFKIHKFSLGVSIPIFGLYFVYVLICVIMDKCEQKDSEEESNINGDFEIRTFNDLLSGDANNTVESDEAEEGDVNLGTATTEGRNENKNVDFDMSDFIERSFFTRKSNAVELKKLPTVKAEKMMQIMQSKFYYSMVRSLLNKGGKVDWKKKTICGKILYFIVDFPMDLMRLVTIPPFNEDTWNQNAFIAMPVCIIIFISIICELFTKGYYKKYWYVFVFLYIIAIAISLLFYMTTKKNTMPTYLKSLLFASFVMSILWLWATTNLLMQMLSDMKMLMPVQIPESFLTMTILAIGNSLPDFIVNCSLAKSGYAEMALSGSIGAPAFGILFGFGLSMIKKGATEDSKLDFILEWNDDPQNRIMICAIGGITLHIIHLIITGFVTKYNLKRYPTSIIGFVITSCYFVSIILFTFVIRDKNN